MSFPCLLTAGHSLDQSLNITMSGQQKFCNTKGKINQFVICRHNSKQKPIFIYINLNDHSYNAFTMLVSKNK